MTKSELNKRRRLQPKLYDFSFSHCKFHLNALKLFKELLYQIVTKPILLDIGCGDKPLLPLFPETTYLGIDIGSNSAADFVIDCNIDPFPLNDNSVDAIILSNSLEHIHNTALVLSEIRRVLKPGGLLFFSVPMCFPIHAHPADYLRFTPYFFEQAFSDCDVLLLQGTNSILSVPLLLSMQIAEMLFPRWFTFFPNIVLNSCAFFLDQISKLIILDETQRLIRKLWHGYPNEIEQLINKVLLSCPIEVNGIFKKK